MGRASRWLKGLFSKKSKDRNKQISSGDSGNGENAPITHIPGNLLPAESAWLRTYMAETEKEQNKHALAVAAATAAAADAAVAAAQAAVAVVRLTSNGRVGGFIGGGRGVAGTGKERWAAEKIQSVFRGYLARKAHRALKGLVKLQALVRGFLVRKRAAATLHSMQALIRAQKAARSQRIKRSSLHKDSNIFQPQQSIDRFDEGRGEIHSKRMSVSIEKYNNNTYDESSPKIVEIDTYKARSRSRRMNIAVSEYGDDILYEGKDCEWSFPLEKHKSATAQNTPRFTFPANHNNHHFYTPSSPAKSLCNGDACLVTGNIFTPSYMAKTQSFKAKLRSHSAPRQRPERRRLSLDEVMAARSSVSGVRMVQPQLLQQQQEQRSSCSSYDHQFEDATHFRFFH